MKNFRYTCPVVICIGVGKIGRIKSVINFNLWKHFKPWVPTKKISIGKIQGSQCHAVNSELKDYTTSPQVKTKHTNCHSFAL